MNNLENSIKDCISKELEKGIIEKVISDKLEKCIESALEDMFGWRGEVKKVIDSKIKSVMIPYLEDYDYSEYITKLDSVLVDVLKNSTTENKKLLENFKELMSVNEIPKKMKITDLFKKWCDYCEEKVDRSNLEFDFDGTYISLSFEVEEISINWSNCDKRIVKFECEEDDSMNIEFIINRWTKIDENFTLNWNKIHDLKSLKHLSEFDMLMMNIDQAYCKIEIDKECDSDERFIEYEE
ncbi:hypothetical protein [Abyssisolibacter fermentans]|uniref:hypothetical protein n=1 Tax=Abyssisolibacter fermentans TaxID=1766203 RepID=UPI00083097D1|nr:hypothetical protein [Abyssisolibacter fermentans]